MIVHSILAAGIGLMFILYWTEREKRQFIEIQAHKNADDAEKYSYAMDYARQVFHDDIPQMRRFLWDAAYWDENKMKTNWPQFYGEVQHILSGGKPYVTLNGS